MESMTIATPAWLPRGRAFTVDDLQAAPDDGNRYELIDGALVVTPAPSWPHQTVVLELAVLLRSACPADLQVLVAPFDVKLADDTVVQPDVLVAERSALTHLNLPVPPVLVVEVLSPSTRGLDLLTKRDRLRRAGCPSYWVVDPVEGRLTGWDLQGGVYVEVADVPHGAAWTASSPFEVTIDPATLLD